MRKLIAKMTRLHLEIKNCICDEQVCVHGNLCQRRNAALVRAIAYLDEATQELRRVQDLEALKR